MKRIIGLIAVFAVVASVATFAEGQQQTGQIKLTWSTASVPGDAHTEAIPVVKAELEKLSNGTMTIDYYHSGQLFSQNDDQNAAMMGKVDMVYSSAAWLAQHVPTMSMFAAAFTFQSYTQMTGTPWFLAFSTTIVMFLVMRGESQAVRITPTCTTTWPGCNTQQSAWTTRKSPCVRRSASTPSTQKPIII